MSHSMWNPDKESNLCPMDWQVEPANHLGHQEVQEPVFSVLMLFQSPAVNMKDSIKALKWVKKCLLTDILYGRLLKNSSQIIYGFS